MFRTLSAVMFGTAVALAAGPASAQSIQRAAVGDDQALAVALIKMGSCKGSFTPTSELHNEHNTGALMLTFSPGAPLNISLSYKMGKAASQAPGDPNLSFTQGGAATKVAVSGGKVTFDTDKSKFNLSTTLVGNDVVRVSGFYNYGRTNLQLTGCERR